MSLTEDIDTFFNSRPAPRTGELEKLRRKDNAQLRADNERLRATVDRLQLRLERAVAANHPGVAK